MNILALLMEVYTDSIKIARDTKQTVGENNDYYITLEQLNNILIRYKDVYEYKK